MLDMLSNPLYLSLYTYILPYNAFIYMCWKLTALLFLLSMYIHIIYIHIYILEFQKILEIQCQFEIFYLHTVVKQPYSTSWHTVNL
jgi:hypothetical protein